MDDLIFCIKRARDGTRTRDLHLGKVALHKLSHSRKLLAFRAPQRKNGNTVYQLYINFKSYFLTTIVILLDMYR